MKKDFIRSTLLPLVVIPLVGLLALGVCYLLFLLANSLLDSLFFAANPQAAPVYIIRRVFALVLLVLYLILLRTKIPDLIKAAVLVGPLGFLTTTAILTFYQKPAWAVTVTAGIAAVSTFLVFKSKKPWFYYYAVAITILVSVLLAWPQA